MCLTFDLVHCTWSFVASEFKGHQYMCQVGLHLLYLLLNLQLPLQSALQLCRSEDSP